MTQRPSRVQRELLNFIADFISTHGYGPSYREIMNGLGLKSVSTVATHVNNLTMQGLLRKTSHSARSLELVGVQTENFTKITDILPSQEKWLVDIITAKFAEADKKPATQKQIDDLFVLVGALHVLGLEDVAKTFKTRLLKISPATD